MVINHRIPNEKKQEVIDVMDKVTPMLPNPSRKYLLYLFEVYNQYIAPSHRPEDINCGGCRALVISKLRYLTNEWKQQSTTLDK